jgi:hypothetical protein
MPAVELRPKTKIWYTANGRDIQVRQMQDDHIRNCCNMIARSGWKWRRRFWVPLQRELIRRRAVELYLRG